MISVNGSTEDDAVSKVTVRWLSDNEFAQFNYYLEQEHYLETNLFVGQSLHYVGEIDGQWVALLAFNAAPLHLKGRKHWFGLVANKSRFLVLPRRRRYPNLASRVIWS